MNDLLREQAPISAAAWEQIDAAASRHDLASASRATAHRIEAYPDVVAEAAHRPRSEGVAGPYGIALGPRCNTGLTRSTTRGYPIIDHVRKLVDGPIVWAPGDASLTQSI